MINPRPHLSEARSLNEIANICIQREDYKECLKYCRRVREILRTNHDEIIMAHNLEILGKVLYGIGKKKWALKALKKAAGIFEKHNIMDSDLADTCPVMANVYVEIGENESAKGTFNRSIEILSKNQKAAKSCWKLKEVISLIIKHGLILILKWSVI